MDERDWLLLGAVALVSAIGGLLGVAAAHGETWLRSRRRRKDGER